MNKQNAQEWEKRCEIPDPQIKDAADQYEAAHRHLIKQPPESFVLLPSMNTAAVAIELYLKCLSAEKVHVPTNDGSKGYMVHSQPALQGHILTSLFDLIPDDVRNDLAADFAKTNAALSRNFRDTLSQIEGAFMTTRYPFEADADLSGIAFDDLVSLSGFLHKFVAGLIPRETIHWK